MLLTAKEVALELRVNKQTVLRWLRTGKLKGFKVSRGKTADWRMDSEDLNEYVRQQKEAH